MLARIRTASKEMAKSEMAATMIKILTIMENMGELRRKALRFLRLMAVLVKLRPRVGEGSSLRVSFSSQVVASGGAEETH